MPELQHAHLLLSLQFQVVKPVSSLLSLTGAAAAAAAVSGVSGVHAAWQQCDGVDSFPVVKGRERILRV